MARLSDTLPPVRIDDAQTHIKAGTVISERYRVIDELGAGGFGVVYEVEHLTLKKRFALKVLNQAKGVEVERLRREALATSRISHPNIVDVTDFGTLPDGNIYYVMELLRGEPLLDVINRKGAFSLSNALPILAAAAHAIQAAHEAGVIHRDLKPSNFFVIPQEDAQRGGTRDFIKILDFGLAKVKLPPDSQKLTAHGLTVGTVGYAAPEQLQGKAVDGRADIYALGCLAFELFAGKELFTGSMMRVALDHVDKPAPLVRERNPAAKISSDMEQLIARCLEKDPGARFASCSELLENLREIARIWLTPDGQTWVGAYEPGAMRKASDSWLEETDEHPWWEQISSQRLVGLIPGAPAGGGVSLTERSGEISPDEFLEKTRPDPMPLGASRELPSSDESPWIEKRSVQISSQRATRRHDDTEENPFEEQPTKHYEKPRLQALLVDDDPDLVMQLTHLLKGHDCSLLVSDGASALNAARERRPAVILVSVELAGTSGYAVCGQLKKDEALKAIPLALLCNHPDDEVFALHRTLPVRAEAYLAKPIIEGALAETIAQLLRPRAPAAAVAPDFERRDVTERVESYDTQRAKKQDRSHSLRNLLIVAISLLVVTVGISLYLALTR